MVIKLSNNGAAKKYFESINSSNTENNIVKAYKYAKLNVKVKHIHETNDIYDAVEITPFDFASNMQNCNSYEKYMNFSKFLFLLSDEIPFTFVLLRIINGKENGEKTGKIFYGHEIMFTFHDLTNVNETLIKHETVKQINKKHNANLFPKNCIQPNKKLLNVECKMLIDFEKCYTGNLKKLLKMIKQINKKQEPIKLTENATKSFNPEIVMSDEDFDNAIKIITFSSNIYETIECKFLGGEKLAKKECLNQLLYYKNNFQTFISDVKTVLQMIINEYANFEPASNIAKFLPGIYQSCFYLFTNLLENIVLVKEIQNCSELLEQFFKANKIISKLIWFSKQWFYLYETNSMITKRVLNDNDPSKFTILVNSKTSENINFLYNENNCNILWMFDFNSTKDCEPKIISENKKYLFGIIPSKNNLSCESKTENIYYPGILTYEIYKDNKPRFWLCSNCKCLLQTIKRNPLIVKCKCRLNLFEKMEKFSMFAENSTSKFVQSEPEPVASVTTDVEIKLSSQFGQIFVDVYDKPFHYASVTEKFMECKND